MSSIRLRKQPSDAARPKAALQVEALDEGVKQHTRLIHLVFVCALALIALQYHFTNSRGAPALSGAMEEPSV